MTKDSLNRDRGAAMRAIATVAAVTLFSGAVAMVMNFAYSTGQWLLMTTHTRDLAKEAKNQTIGTERYHQVLDDGDDWLEDLRSGRIWQKQSSVSASKPRHRRVRRHNNGWSNGTYRTVCVRLCDGYYFPISTATRPSRFPQDDRNCRERCDAPARLFVHMTHGGSADDMKDLRRRDYVSLENAFRYRVAYDPNCKCRAHPWEAESRQRHAGYANQEAKERKSRDKDKVSRRGRRTPQVAGSLYRAPRMALGAGPRRSKSTRKRARQRKRSALRRSDWRKSVLEVRD